MKTKPIDSLSRFLHDCFTAYASSGISMEQAKQKMTDDAYSVLQQFLGSDTQLQHAGLLSSLQSALFFINMLGKNAQKKLQDPSSDQQLIQEQILRYKSIKLALKQAMQEAKL